MKGKKWTDIWVVSKCGLPFDGPFPPHPLLWLSFKNLKSFAIFTHEHKILGLLLKISLISLSNSKPESQKKLKARFFARFSKPAMILSWFFRILKLKENFLWNTCNQPCLGHYENAWYYKHGPKPTFKVTFISHFDKYIGVIDEWNSPEK